MSLAFGSATAAQRDFVLAVDGGVGLVDAATWALDLCLETEAALARRQEQHQVRTAACRRWRALPPELFKECVSGVPCRRGL